MHIVSILAGDDYMKMEKVLGEPVMDVFSYLDYSDARARAEKSQHKFLSDLEKGKR